jgi:hypothetical protein
MCGTAITQGCMLGHAKDEFFDEKTSILALAQRTVLQRMVTYVFL